MRNVSYSSMTACGAPTQMGSPSSRICRRRSCRPPRSPGRPRSARAPSRPRSTTRRPARARATSSGRCTWATMRPPSPPACRWPSMRISDTVFSGFLKRACLANTPCTVKRHAPCQLGWCLSWHALRSAPSDGLSLSGTEHSAHNSADCSSMISLLQGRLPLTGVPSCIDTAHGRVWLLAVRHSRGSQLAAACPAHAEPIAEAALIRNRRAPMSLAIVSHRRGGTPTADRGWRCTGGAHGG